MFWSKRRARREREAREYTAQMMSYLKTLVDVGLKRMELDGKANWLKHDLFYALTSYLPEWVSWHVSRSRQHLMIRLIDTRTLKPVERVYTISDLTLKDWPAEVVEMRDKAAEY